MNQNSYDFKVTVPLEKSIHEGGWYIKGIAAAANYEDRAGDVMLPEAIEMLAAQINNSPVPFRNTHNADDIKADMGEVVKAVVTPDFQLEVEVHLDEDNPDAKYLWDKLGKGKKFGMSIKGSSENPIIEKGQRNYISKHRAITLKEVSATTQPFFVHSLGTVLRKAMTEADASLANIGENTTMADSITGETPAQESSAPEQVTAATEVSPSEELVKSLMANDEFKTLIKTAVAEAATPAVETQASESSVEDSTEVSKSETEADTVEETDAAGNVTEIVKSAIEEVSKAFAAQLEVLASRIPDTADPVLLEKSERESADETIATLRLDPHKALRTGLAAKHGMIDRL